MPKAQLVPGVSNCVTRDGDNDFMPRSPLATSCTWAWAGTVLLAACNPSLNWREVQQKDHALLALMPCKAVASSRQVNLGGHTVDMNLNSCTAADATFVVGTATVQPADAAVALDHWKQAVLANIFASGQTPVASAGPISVSGMPALQTLLTSHGKRPDGSAVQISALWFAQGGKLFHAAIYANTVSPDMSEPFFNGLKLP